MKTVDVNAIPAPPPPPPSRSVKGDTPKPTSHSHMHAQEAASQITLKVRLHGVQMLRLRTWIGVRIIQLGARVIGCGGCGVLIEQDDGQKVEVTSQGRGSVNDAHQA